MADLTPDQAIEIALRYHRSNRLAEAEAIYRQILAREPQSARALQCLGMLLMQQGHADAAVELINRALAQTPENLQLLTVLGNVLQSQGRLQEALDISDRALAIDPHHARAHHARGQILSGLQRHAEAAEDFRKAIATDPGNAELWHHLGFSLLELEHFDAAIDAYRRGIRIEASYASLHNLGHLLIQRQRLPEAIATLRAAIEVNPTGASAHWALGTALLSEGDFAAGWPQYEWRWQCDRYLEPRRNFAQPRFIGQDVRGKIVLIYNEQGFGDTIQFVRYAPLLAERGARVIVACAAELARLFRDLPGVEQVVTENPPPFDFQCPMMSLPLAFGTQVETIPARIPYLSADRELSAAWAVKVSEAGDALRVGIVWAGRPAHPDDRNRSIALDRWAPLLATPGVRFYSLQTGRAAEHLVRSPLRASLIDLTADLHDFADAAAFVEHLDLVITVDTAIAHLAGAMGKATWVLLPFAADWRWLQKREDSPWYPTLRLFRQKTAGDWGEVIARVGEALGALGSRE